MSTPAAPIKRLLVVSHVPSPNTRRLSDAVVRGARDENIEHVEVQHSRPLDTDADDVLTCDAILIGTCENFGYMSGATKDFFERVYYPCLERTEGLPWGLWVRAGNDGSGATHSVTRIVTGLRWRAIQTPLVLSGEWNDDFIVQAQELGMLAGASLDVGVI